MMFLSTRRCALASTVALVLLTVGCPEARSSDASEGQLRIRSQVRNLTRGMCLQNRAAQASIDALCDRLAEASQPSESPSSLRCRLLHHDTPMVFSVGPGDVYVTTGAMDLCEDDDELAVLLARELYFLRDSNRVHGAVRSHLMVHRGVAAISVAAWAVMLGGLVSETAGDPLQSSGVSPGDYATILVPWAPVGLMQLMHNSGIGGAEIAPRWRSGRDLKSNALSDVGAFDSCLVGLLHRGFSGDDELAADTFAHDLTTGVGYRSDALVTLLEHAAMSHTFELSRIREAKPGLERRLRSAEERASVEQQAR